jgi:hypothetical protein
VFSIVSTNNPAMEPFSNNAALGLYYKITVLLNNQTNNYKIAKDAS